MKLSEHVRCVGVNDFRPFLFENQWTLPHGVSYNSYLVVDEKIALVSWFGIIDIRDDSYGSLAGNNGYVSC